MLLQQAGIECLAMPDDVDEVALRASLPGLEPGALAQALAAAKAARVSSRVPEALVRVFASHGDETSVHVNLHQQDDSYLFGETTKRVRGRDRLRE